MDQQNYPRMSMEAGEIIRRNVAIAKYMMWKEATKENFRGAKVPVFTLETEFAPITLKEADFSFHNDWSWLMPVVERIAKSWDSKILIGIYHDSPLNFPRAIWDAIWLMSNKDKPLIESVWLAVSDYILSLEK